MIKISSFTTITDPERRQDPWLESIASALAFSHEVVVVDGSTEEVFKKNWDALQNRFPDNWEKIKHIHYPWPDDWGWEELPRHLSKGLESCTGEWAIKFDADYVFDDDWADHIQKVLQRAVWHRLVAFNKISVVLHNRVYEKGANPIAINRSYSDIKIGLATDRNTDLCYPIISEGWDAEKKIHTGVSISDLEIYRSKLKFWNYDYTFKTEDVTRAELLKFSMAWKKFFGITKLGQNEAEAFDLFIDWMQERLGRCPYTVQPKHHPSFIRDRIARIAKSMFGYDGFGRLST